MISTHLLYGYGGVSSEKAVNCEAGGSNVAQIVIDLVNFGVILHLVRSHEGEGVKQKRMIVYNGEGVDT